MSILLKFIEYLRKERRLSEHTIRNYKSDLDQMTCFMIEEFENDDLEDDGLNFVWI